MSRIKSMLFIIPMIIFCSLSLNSCKAVKEQNIDINSALKVNEGAKKAILPKDDNLRKNNIPPIDKNHMDNGNLENRHKNK